MEVLAPNQYNFAFGNDRVIEGSNGGDALRKCLEAELRAAKARLEVGEVAVPAGLLPAVARQCLALAEKEPCGVRGATLFLALRDGRAPDQPATPVATLKLDYSTVSTFELHLTLNHVTPVWTNLLPHFLKNLAGSGTLVISPEFTLTKKQLYRPYQQE